MNNYIVYMLIFPNNKFYIGLTQQNPNRRWRGGAGYDGQPVKQEMYKVGWKNIEHIILKENLTKEEAEYYEQYYITKYNSNDERFGYNLTTGGTFGTIKNNSSNLKTSDSRKGIIFSQEHREHISEALKNYFSNDENTMGIEKMKYNDMINQPRRKTIRCVETGVIYPSSRNAGKHTNTNYRRILDVCYKKYGRKTAGGYHWEFVEGE